jgi:RNA polymerase sigma-70 factor (ECF subfamily)
MTERDNEGWVAALSEPGPARAAALEDLRQVLERGLNYALSKRRGVDAALIEDFTQDALLKILDALDSFRGESRFTTWAQKIAVRVAYTELRRARWRDVSLEKITDTPEGVFIPQFMSDPAAGPERRAQQQAVLDTVSRAIQEDLTDLQRQALVAVGIRGIPIEEVARRMDTNRNALYKLLHDARQRLKRALLEQGLSSEEILATFE